MLKKSADKVAHHPKERRVKLSNIRRSNPYHIDGNICYVVCGDGTEFIMDVEKHPLIEDRSCYCNRGRIVTSVNRMSVPVSHVITGVSSGTKVLHKNGNALDLRLTNLFYENKYLFVDDYVVGTCFDGREFKVDRADFDLISPYIWHIDKNNYVITKTKQGRVIKQHRLIMGVVDTPTIEVDHIYHDTHDNRRAKLRLVTRSINCFNRRLSSLNTSGVAGVYWSDAAQKWAVQINKDGKRQYLGVYDTIEEAAAVRRQAEQFMYGQHVG